jgi:spermidine/putrescine transport system ATP-binding protein
VAGFIGTSNLLSGTVTSTDPATGGAVIDLGDGGRIVVPAAHKQPGDELEITVRPEKITLVANGAGAALPAPAGQHDCALRGTVTEVVYLGTSTNYNVTTSAGAEVMVYSQNSANDASGPQRGEQVWLHWDSANSYAIGNTQ